MKLNESQIKTVNDFIIRYNSDEEFSKNIQELYNNEPGQLSILYIFALEEISRYGNKNVYSNFINAKGVHTEEQAVNLVDGFTQLLNQDPNFKQYKLDQLANSPETLSELERFVFELRKQPESQKSYEGTVDELEYDPLSPILFGTDQEIKVTIGNLFFGEFIHKVLDLPSMKSIKERQKADGRIANSDKKTVISVIFSSAPIQETTAQLQQVINQKFLRAKLSLLMGAGENVFGESVNFNTNITVYEIFGITKDTDAFQNNFFDGQTADSKGPYKI